MHDDFIIINEEVTNMIISQMYNGIATANVEEGSKIFTEKLGYTVKHRLNATGCKIYVMENQYNEFDLVEGDAFKPGTSVFRISVRDFADSVNDALNDGLKQISDTVDDEKIKFALFTNDDGVIFIISHHKKENIYV